VLGVRNSEILSALLIAAIAALGAAQLTFAAAPPEPIGSIERFDPAFDAIVPPGARVERLADGFIWAEGPAWVEAGSYLLFTDVPGNTLYRWSAVDGLSVFLKPSGHAGPDFTGLREAGANGLFSLADDTVLLADSGNRLIARLSVASKQKTVLASRYQGRRFNSPNDLVRRSNGAIYFTDPPYGLERLNDSPLKELAFNGVYRLDPDGRVSMIDDQLSFPNGIALSPDQTTLYVANSDAKRPIWTAYRLDATGAVVQRRVLADASDLVNASSPGLPDGMTVDAQGHLFATAPGGVLVMTAEGRRLGLIRTGGPIANCEIGNNGRTLYMTSRNLLARVQLVTKTREH